MGYAPVKGWAYFKCSVSPLEITYIPTGQKILFRGLDDPLKVTSITVEVGALCRLWIEEAYEIMVKMPSTDWMNLFVVSCLTDCITR